MLLGEKERGKGGGGGGSCLVQAIAPSAAGHGPACELIHNDNLCAANNVVDIPLLQLLGLDGIDQVRGPLLSGVIQVRHLPANENVKNSTSRVDMYLCAAAAQSPTKLSVSFPDLAQRLRSNFPVATEEPQHRV